MTSECYKKMKAVFLKRKKEITSSPEAAREFLVDSGLWDYLEDVTPETKSSKLDISPEDIKLSPDILDQLGFSEYWEDCGGISGRRCLENYRVREYPFVQDTNEGNNPYGPDTQYEHIESENGQRSLNTLKDLLLNMRETGFMELSNKIQNSISLNYNIKDFRVP